jgi:thiol:disulfide interchange protein DsbD
MCSPYPDPPPNPPPLAPIPTPPTTTLHASPQAELSELLAAAEASERPLLVVFSATWCGPCKLLTKQLVGVRNDMRAAGGPGSDVEMVKIEAPEEEALASRLGVHQLPCSFFVGPRGPGAPAMRLEGLLSASVIEEAVRGKAAVLGSDLRRAVRL